MYFSNSPQDEKELLKESGVSSFEELIPSLPKNHTYPGLGLPKGVSEVELTQHITELAKKNQQPLSFLGAGAYDHFVSSVVPSLAGRSEFATAYTPYQAEASQGTLQTIFEFQSLVAEIYGMDLANASLYDGATALVEAALLAFRHTGKQTLIIPDSLHPHSKRTLETYFYENPNFKLVTVACHNGVVSPSDLEAKLEANKGQVAAVSIQTPNFFGCIEDGESIGKKAHAADALLIVSANPLSLGILTPPGEYDADMAVGEGQPIGLPISFGGPYVGLFTCKKEFMRKMPGRICGQTKDQDGRTGYVLTLQAREQHIRREKATSNICTNQNLCATAFALQASLLGPDGLKETAEFNLQLAHYAADQLTKIPGVRRAFDTPFFNEFVLEVPNDIEPVTKKLSDLNIIGGLPLKKFFPKLDQHLLVNVTEKKTKGDIDRFTSALRSSL